VLCDRILHVSWASLKTLWVMLANARLHVNCTSCGIRWNTASTAKEWRVNTARTAPEQGMEQNSLLLPAMRLGDAE
jgi:hypothetical protein